MLATIILGLTGLNIGRNSNVPYKARFILLKKELRKLTKSENEKRTYKPEEQNNG